MFISTEESAVGSTTVPSTKKTEVRVQFRITNTAWNPKLADNKSPEFTVLADKLHQAVCHFNLQGYHANKNHIERERERERERDHMVLLLSMLVLQLKSLLSTVPGFVDVKIVQFRSEV